jgi:hypothetical protein
MLAVVVVLAMLVQLVQVVQAVVVLVVGLVMVLLELPILAEVEAGVITAVLVVQVVLALLF